MLVPCGTPFGIKMFTNGVVVVGMSDIDSETGKVNPAEQSGLKMEISLLMLMVKLFTKMKKYQR